MGPAGEELLLAGSSVAVGPGLVTEEATSSTARPLSQGRLVTGEIPDDRCCVAGPDGLGGWFTESLLERDGRCPTPLEEPLALMELAFGRLGGELLAISEYDLRVVAGGRRGHISYTRYFGTFPSASSTAFCQAGQTSEPTG